jgi:acyl-CoA thioesterase
LGFASNSHGVHTLAQNCAITYLKPGRLGDRLFATAKPVTKQGRTGIYDITVTRRTETGDEVLAEFRGHTRDVDGKWV